MDLTEITEDEKFSREIFHLFRGALLFILGRKKNHPRARTENEIKTGLEVKKVKWSRERHIPPEGRKERA